jgi:hypothetical protein
MEQGSLHWAHARVDKGSGKTLGAIKQWRPRSEWHRARVLMGADEWARSI